MTTDAVLTALADPTRRQLLDVLAVRGEGTATTLAAELPVSRLAAIKRLAESTVEQEPPAASAR